MNATKSIILPIGLVFLLSIALFNAPVWSFMVAWLGSFLLFYLSWFKNPQNTDTRSIAFQFMRPLYLLQLIFAGFMCCTSIFYMVDHLGYEYFEKVNVIAFQENAQTYLIAKCQRLAFLAHIGLVWGILQYRGKSQNNKIFSLVTHKKNLLLKLAVGFYVIAIGFKFLPGLFQFSIYFNNIAIFIASLLLLKGLRTKNSIFLTYGLVMFGLNFINATLTGYKEHILINFIILFSLLLPYYRRLMIVLSFPTIYILLYILPTYAGIIRQQSWSGDKTATEARAEAFETIFQDDSEEQIGETNWTFLTNRFSEIGMFTKFVEYVPTKHPFYEWGILENSMVALVPRVFYPDKPITEKVAMERVYDAGVVSELSLVSAKTRPVVDAYLSFGYLGVFVLLFLLGYAIQFFNNTAERWFGGYELGCIVMFNGCFQVLWRGNNFEFMLNNMLFGFITMWLVFLVLRKLQILVPIRSGS